MNPVPITMSVRRNTSRNAVGLAAAKPENMYLVEKLIPRTINAVRRAVNSRLEIVDNFGARVTLRVAPVWRPSTRITGFGARACCSFGHSWFCGCLWSAQWTRSQYLQTEGT